VLHHAVIDTSRFVGNAPSFAALTDADNRRLALPRTPLRPTPSTGSGCARSSPAGSAGASIPTAASRDCA